MTLESPNLPDLAASGVGIVIFCPDQRCGRASQYVPIDQALAKFGPVSLRQLSGRLFCQTCRDADRPARVSVGVSTLDMDDARHGRPPGTTERQRAEKYIANVASDREQRLANGWAPLPRETIPPTPWWT